MPQDKNIDKVRRCNTCLYMAFSALFNAKDELKKKLDAVLGVFNVEEVEDIPEDDIRNKATGARALAFGLKERIELLTLKIDKLSDLMDEMEDLTDLDYYD